MMAKQNHTSETMAEKNNEAWLHIVKISLSMSHIKIKCSQTFCHQSSKVRLLKVSIIMIHLTHGFRCYSLLLLYYLVKVARFDLVARHANARHGRAVTAVWSNQVVDAYKAIQE